MHFYKVYEIIDYQPKKITKYVLMVVCCLLVLLVWVSQLVNRLADRNALFLYDPGFDCCLVPRRFLRVWLVVLMSALDWLIVEAITRTHVLPEWEMLISEFIRVVIFLMLVFVLSELRLALQRESELARRDVLTKLANRRAFFETAKIEIGRAKRYGYPLTAVMIDLDNFKLVNDQQGHEVGDLLLLNVAKILNNNIRSSDFAGRLGGDEFAILLPETGGMQLMPLQPNYKVNCWQE